MSAAAPPSPPPPILHTCHESHVFASSGKVYYTKAFSDYTALVIIQHNNSAKRDQRKYQRLKTAAQHKNNNSNNNNPEEQKKWPPEKDETYEADWKPSVPEQRYIWLNWEADIISLAGDEDAFKHLVRPSQNLVRKLKLESSQMWPFIIRGQFADVKEVHIVAMGGYRMWWCFSGAGPGWDKWLEDAVMVHDEMPTGMRLCPRPWAGKR